MITRFKRTYSEEQRVSFVNEVLESGSNILIAKKHDINPKLLSAWVGNYRRYGQTIKPKAAEEQEVIPNYKKEYLRLKKELEYKELEVQVLNDLLKKKTQR